MPRYVITWDGELEGAHLVLLFYMYHFFITGFLYVLICLSNPNHKKSYKGAVLSLLLPLMVSSVFLAFGAPHFGVDLHRPPTRMGRTLLMHWDDRIINLEDKRYLAGYIIGVFSAGLYVCSRVPQIIKNVSLYSLSFLLVTLCVDTVTFSLCVVLWKVFLCTCSS